MLKIAVIVGISSPIILLLVPALLDPPRTPAGVIDCNRDDLHENRGCEKSENVRVDLHGNSFLPFYKPVSIK